MKWILISVSKTVYPCHYEVDAQATNVISQQTQRTCSSLKQSQLPRPDRAVVGRKNRSLQPLSLSSQEPHESDTSISSPGTVGGLKPGLHGFHVHAEGNLGDSCKAAGGHFNPLMVGLVAVY